MNSFWRVLKGLEGRTVAEVRPHLVRSEETKSGWTENGLEVVCTDGYTAGVAWNWDEHEFTLVDVE